MATEEDQAEIVTPEAAPEPPPKLPAKPQAPPARELPDIEGIARWANGEDYPLLGVLFENLPLKKFDALVMQIKKEELLPQHWQVITAHHAPDELAFDDLYEVGRLRVQYKDQELSRRRLAALEVAWEELRGKAPSLWSASDVFAALRRVIQKKREVSFYELLTVIRDVWSNLRIPHGKEQTEVLWACLEFARKKTRK